MMLLRFEHVPASGRGGVSFKDVGPLARNLPL
jgi:hypothetical protein